MEKFNRVLMKKTHNRLHCTSVRKCGIV